MMDEDEPFTAEGEGALPLGSKASERRCTDGAWLLLLLAAWTGMAYVAAVSYAEGNPQRLSAGFDMEGNLCGTLAPQNNGGTLDLRARPYVYFACLQFDRLHSTVCVAECPRVSGHFVTWYNGTQIECLTRTLSSNSNLGRLIPATTYPSTRLQQNCVPSAMTLYSIVSNVIDQTTFPSVVAGVQKAWGATLFASLMAAVLAAAWMGAAKHVTKPGTLAVGTLVLAVVALVLFATALWLRAGYLTGGGYVSLWSALAAGQYPEMSVDPEGEDAILEGSSTVATNIEMSIGFALLASAFALGVGIALWCGLLERLMQTGGILCECFEAMSALPALGFCLPLLLTLLQLLLFGYWMVVSLYIASAGEADRGLLTYDDRVAVFFTFHTITTLWTAEVLVHLGQCVAAGVLVRWYFGSRELHRNGYCVVLQQLGSTLRYSSGSLVVGALVMIPGRVFRFFLEHCLHQAQVDSQGKTRQELHFVANCCFRCCLDKLTRFVQYMSHNAYVYVTTRDYSFAEGARAAFELTLGSIGEVALLTAGERLVLTLAKLAISCICTAGAVVSMRLGDIGAMDNMSGSLLFTFMLTFVVADTWLAVLDAAVETIFLCYLVDAAENETSEVRPSYASARLRSYMARHKPSLVVPSASVDIGSDEMGHDELLQVVGEYEPPVAAPADARPAEGAGSNGRDEAESLPAASAPISSS